MNQNKQAKLSKNIQLATLEIGHATKTMFISPYHFFISLINSAIEPIAQERIERLSHQKSLEFPDWAKNTYTRDWNFEDAQTKREYISQVRSEAGRRGGKVSKKA